MGMLIKRLGCGMILVALAAGAQQQVDIYNARDLQARGQVLAKKQGQFASEELKRYGNHYMMLAYRDRTGSSEVHQHEADVFVIESGNATLLSGGEMIGPHTTAPGEIRGTSINGGERREIGPGDVVHIPAGVPHQLLIETGKPFTYFVVKVTGQ